MVLLVGTILGRHKCLRAFCVPLGLFLQSKKKNTGKYNSDFSVVVLPGGSKNKKHREVQPSFSICCTSRGLVVLPVVGLYFPMVESCTSRCVFFGKPWEVQQKNEKNPGSTTFFLKNTGKYI